MPPKRKAAQKGASKVMKAALVPVEKNEVVSSEIEKDPEIPEDVPVKTAVKKGPTKRQKKQESNEKPDEKKTEVAPVDSNNDEPDKENLDEPKLEDEAPNNTEYNVTARRGPRRGVRNKAEEKDRQNKDEEAVAEDLSESEAKESKRKLRRGKIAQHQNVEPSSGTTEQEVETEQVHEIEAPKNKRGGRKGAQAVKETAKETAKSDHEESEGEGSNSSADEPVKETAGKKRGGKKEAPANPKAEPENKKSKLDDSVGFDCDKENKNGEKWNLKIATWNVAGLRACVKKDGMAYVTEEDADIICFQETKCPENKVPAEAKIEGYHTYWASGSKDGYAGVALYSKEKPLKVTYGIGNEEHDGEGRVITAEYDKFYLVTSYVPNAGQGLKTHPKRMEWDGLFRKYLKDLDEQKAVILCGDLNVAHEEIDLANPKTNTKHAGFTPEERENMTALLKEGFVDSYRQLNPDKTGAYTFWSYLGNARSRNTGWRLDYFLVSERLMDSVCDVAIRNQVLGSDHCPLTLFIHI